MSKRVISQTSVLAALVTASFWGTLQLPTTAATSYALQRGAVEQASDSTLSDGVLVAGLSFRLPVRASRWRFGGFARGCAAATEAVDFNDLQQSLAPIAPPVQPNESIDPEDVPVDYTVSAHPTIFVRVPDLPGATVGFTLQNEESTEELYATQFELDGTEGGIVGIQIPTSSPSLEVGQKYTWQVLVSSSCGGNSGEFRLTTNSWIERVELQGALMSVSQVPMRDRPALYAEAGVWQETLSSLVELRMQNPSDAEISESWSSLMESVNLGEYSSEPILRIYSEQ